ncbi:MAG: transcriptional repressor [Pseudomonadota bacterium]
MNPLNNAIDHAEKHCRENGKRLTKKRKIVLRALLQTKKAISAYELVDYCEKQLNEVIPAMSVYRILDFLQGQGLAHKLGLSNKYVVCSDIICDNKNEYLQLLICDSCQRVEEVNIDAQALKTLQTSIEKTGFHPRKPQIEINGICSRCLSAEADG